MQIIHTGTVGVGTVVCLNDGFSYKLNLVHCFFCLLLDFFSVLFFQENFSQVLSQIRWFTERKKKVRQLRVKRGIKIRQSGEAEVSGFVKDC